MLVAAIAWGFGGALVISLLPLTESSAEILKVTSGLYTYFTGKEFPSEEDPVVEPSKTVTVTKAKEAVYEPDIAKAYSEQEEVAC